jgi:hypothetical protein
MQEDVMTAGVLDPPRGRIAQRCVEPLSRGGRATLEERLDSCWRGLAKDVTVECPVCLGRMSIRAEDRRARCAECESILS